MGARGCRSGVPVQSGKAALELGLPPALGARLRPHRPLDPQPTLFTPVIAAHHHHPPWAALCTPFPAKGFPSSDHKLPGIQGPPPRFSPGLHSLRLPEEVIFNMAAPNNLPFEQSSSFYPSQHGSL